MASDLTSVATQVSAAEGESLQKTVENAVKTLPESVQQVLDHAGWVDNAIAHIGDSGVAQPQDVARSIVTYIVEPVVTSLLSILVFLVLFVLLQNLYSSKRTKSFYKEDFISQRDF